MCVDRRDDAALLTGDDRRKRLLLGLVQQDGDERRAVENDHPPFRSSVISRGARRSSTGIAAISRTTCSILARRPAAVSGGTWRGDSAAGAGPAFARLASSA